MKTKNKYAAVTCLLISLDLLVLSIEIFFGYLYYMSSGIAEDALFRFMDYLPPECIAIFGFVLFIAIILPIVFKEKKA